MGPGVIRGERETLRRVAGESCLKRVVRSLAVKRRDGHIPEERKWPGLRAACCSGCSAGNIRSRLQHRISVIEVKAARRMVSLRAHVSKCGCDIVGYRILHAQVVIF